MFFAAVHLRGNFSSGLKGGPLLWKSPPEASWAGLCPFGEREFILPSIYVTSKIYFISTTNTSPRQLVPMVQVEDPDSEPRVPIQSEENTKNFPSCETLPIPYLLLKSCERVVMKLCAKRQVVPDPSAATAMISLYQGEGKGVVVL